jgi:hypothetical protein
MVHIGRYVIFKHEALNEIGKLNEPFARLGQIGDLYLCKCNTPYFLIINGEDHELLSISKLTKIDMVDEMYRIVTPSNVTYLRKI